MTDPRLGWGWGWGEDTEGEVRLTAPPRYRAVDTDAMEVSGRGKRALGASEVEEPQAAAGPRGLGRLRVTFAPTTKENEQPAALEETEMTTEAAATTDESLGFPDKPNITPLEFARRSNPDASEESLLWIAHKYSSDAVQWEMGGTAGTFHGAGTNKMGIDTEPNGAHLIAVSATSEKGSEFAQQLRRIIMQLTDIKDNELTVWPLGSPLAARVAGIRFTGHRMCQLAIKFRFVTVGTHTLEPSTKHPMGFSMAKLKENFPLKVSMPPGATNDDLVLAFVHAQEQFPTLRHMDVMVRGARLTGQKAVVLAAASSRSQDAWVAIAPELRKKMPGWDVARGEKTKGGGGQLGDGEHLVCFTEMKGGDMALKNAVVAALVPELREHKFGLAQRFELDAEAKQVLLYVEGKDEPVAEVVTGGIKQGAVRVNLISVGADQALRHSFSFLHQPEMGAAEKVDVNIVPTSRNQHVKAEKATDAPYMAAVVKQTEQQRAQRVV